MTAIVSLKKEINKRKDDIQKLLELLKTIDTDDELYSVISSAIFLAAYNLIEYLLREVILTICDEINSNNKHYFEIKNEIRKHLFDSAKKEHAQHNIELLFNHSACKFKPNNNSLLSGNVNQRYLRETLEKYAVFVKWPRTVSLITLDTLKDIRNELSHGHKAFSEIKFSLEDINNFIMHLEEISLLILDKLEISLNEQLYCIEE